MDSFFHQQLQFSRTFTKKINEQIAELDLYQSQWSILFYLKRVESATLVEISHYFQVEKPTVTRTVNRLEKRGFIQKVSSPDKRERRIQLTEKGIDIYCRALAIIEPFEQNLMDGISAEDLEITIRTLNQLQQRLH